MKELYKVKKDYTGKQFKARYVLGVCEEETWRNGKRYRTVWNVRCNCGNILKSLTQALKLEHCMMCAHKDPRPYRRKRPFESVYNNFVKRAKYPVSITYKDFVELATIKNCHYCNAEIIWHEYGRSQKRGGGGSNLDRQDNNKPYNIDNVVVCCGRCNYAKGAHFSYYDWVEIGKLIKSWDKKVVPVVTPQSKRYGLLLERELEKDGQ